MNWERPCGAHPSGPSRFLMGVFSFSGPNRQITYVYLNKLRTACGATFA